MSLFFMDYASRTRLKLRSHVRLTGGGDAEFLKQFHVPGYRARVERGMIISGEGHDGNCPQHITPRVSQSQVLSIVATFREDS